MAAIAAEAQAFTFIPDSFRLLPGSRRSAGRHRGSEFTSFSHFAIKRRRSALAPYLA
jgi:hypothetical protein